MHPFLRELIPPAARRWRRRGGGWRGDYPSWEAAAATCAGYDTPGILERVKRAAWRVKRGHGAFERDSVVFYEPEHAWPLLAFLLRTAALNRGRLRVLDFGGSLGSVYQQHSAWFEDLDEVSWNVVEQPHFVDCGRTHFEEGGLCFHRTIAECLERSPIDVALLSSVLGYLPRPEAVLDELAAAGVSRLILDRTGFTKDDRERITVQTVPPEIYPAAYPCRFFGKSRLIALLAPAYELAAEFPALDEPPPFAEFLGLAFVRRGDVAAARPAPDPHLYAR